MSTLAEKIAVMQAAERGEEIHVRVRNQGNLWQPCVKPLWNWDGCEYRVKPKEPQRLWVVWYGNSVLDAHTTPGPAEEQSARGKSRKVIEYVEVIK